MNGLKTMGLMVSLTLLLVFVGAALGGKNGMTIALIFAFVMMIVGPIAGMLVQMAISRSREYGADAGGAKISGNPLYLANALNKLQIASQKIPMHANPATSHMFIVNPLTGGGILKLFSTHPPIEERIKRLNSIKQGQNNSS